MPALRKTDVFRRELLAAPFSKQWDAWLSANMAHYPLLSADERTRLQDTVRVVVGEKKWEGCDGLKVTEMMKVTIAAQAALLLLGLEHDYFERVSSVVLFPHAFELPAESNEVRGQTILGQAIDYGSVFLSWDTVLADGRDPKSGRNLVIHEFAHQLDFLDGYTNGVPPLRSRDQTKRWEHVMHGSFQRLRHALQQGEATFLGSYAATNPTEFFSVVSEKFFLTPTALRENHPDLFEVLKEYYRVDPVRWFEGKPQPAAATVHATEMQSDILQPQPEAAQPSIDWDFVDFACPYCAQPLSFPSEQAGSLEECPNCLECSVVPEKSGMPAKRIPKVIQTERLNLQRLQIEDDEDLAEVLSESDNFVYSEAKPMLIEQIREWISSDVRLRFPTAADSCGCYLAIKTPKIIGFVDISYDARPFNVAHFQIVIGKNWQRKGYGMEALRGLLKYFFQDLQIRRVVTTCDARHVGARHLLLKAGFRQESERIEDRFVKGEWVTTLGFAMLKREYQRGVAQS